VALFGGKQGIFHSCGPLLAGFGMEFLAATPVLDSIIT